MNCKQCGSSNNDSDVFCQKCGASLDKDPKIPAKGSRQGLIAGLIAGGVLLIAAVVVLVLLLGGGSPLVGPWHNDELGQLLRFHEDETVVIRTPYGDSEAVYVYDKSGGKGVITLNGEAINFTVEGDSLLLTWSGVQTDFLRGDMEVVPAVAEATPPVTPTPAAAATPTPEVTPAPTPTPAPTTTPTATPVATPSEEPSASLSFGPLLSASFGPLATPTPAISFNPQISGLVISGDILGNLTGSIVGDWISTEDPSCVITFNSDGGFIMNSGSGIQGTYTYDKATHTGTMQIMMYTFDFSVSGDILTQGGNTYKRAS